MGNDHYRRLADRRMAGPATDGGPASWALTVTVAIRSAATPGHGPLAASKPIGAANRRAAYPRVADMKVMELPPALDARPPGRDACERLPCSSIVSCRYAMSTPRRRRQSGTAGSKRYAIAGAARPGSTEPYRRPTLRSEATTRPNLPLSGPQRLGLLATYGLPGDRPGQAKAYAALCRIPSLPVTANRQTAPSTQVHGSYFHSAILNLHRY